MKYLSIEEEVNRTQVAINSAQKSNELISKVKKIFFGIFNVEMEYKFCHKLASTLSSLIYSLENHPFEICKTNNTRL